MIDMLIPVSEAKARLTELVRASDDEEITLLRYGRPAAVIVSAQRWSDLQQELEDLEDRLTAAQVKADPQFEAWEDVKRELAADRAHA